MATREASSNPGESHRRGQMGWLRAATLGANDGLISTSSLIVGVASAQITHSAVLLTAVSGLAAGALSMAAGEYVSVSSQADGEKADLSRESREQSAVPETERAELADIYTTRGVAPDLAAQVADQLMARDALGAHAQDELGIEERTRARPLQAAMTSALAFASGAAIPAILVALLPHSALTIGVVVATMVVLLVLGGLAARLGGASLARGALRVAFWGAVAMGVTALIGRLAGVFM
jgi:VIT1/CCC1 family predicted Fe2+/Mn2+ transporter